MRKIFAKISKQDTDIFYFMFIPVLKIKKVEPRLKIYFFGIQAISFIPKPQKQNLKITSSKDLFIYFDHSYGGGAEIYFHSKLEELLKDKTVLRIQEIHSNYKISIFANQNVFEIFYNWKNLQEILLQVNNSEIYINNLVGYKKIPKLLNFLSKIKSNNNKIIMLGHDYFSICPSWNLINNKGDFCNIPEIKTCTACSKTNSYVFKKYKKTIKKIQQWKQMWDNFLNKTVDEMIVFSQSSKEIFTKAYPFLENKIKIEPHKVKEFEKPVYFEKNTGNLINIVMIGNICYIKGSKIIAEIAKLIKKDKYKNIKLTVIGNYNEGNNVNVSGEYEREMLPQLLKQNKADVVFISSICPETFSYTTSEAMMLKYPVACFNLGAPAQRVKNYEKGLIISKIDAQTALDEIIDFLKTN